MRIVGSRYEDGKFLFIYSNTHLEEKLNVKITLGKSYSFQKYKYCHEMEFPPSNNAYIHNQIYKGTNVFHE